ncbi:AsnC family transcriptional regulator [Leucobacter rhizosphaerae]|uniref:AsnC family transcriptional regulator n=1 Tax=Leucobacter rhizosphaerae TaxID=2932245 RepID=A0ABY4FTC3_9MICO|nr:AsnC family transcriptional regulator [Leucobacter rhizosphaerae]UOQ59555.1 AsnC family transcriptional regulator [Leucobacter rhizosphaerae]
MAQRRDAYSVTAFPGSNRVEGLFLPVGPDAVDEIANDLLPEIDGVIGSELARITRPYRRGHQWHGGRLDAGARQRLLKDIAAEGGADAGIVELTAQDRIITETLERDGRTPAKEVAEAAGVTSQFIGRRMRALFRSGLLQMRTEVSPEVSGLALEAHLRFTVDAARVDALGQHLAADPSIMYCVATTGSHPLECIVKLPRLSDLHAWTTGTLADFSGVVVAECETEPRQVRRANIRFP